MRRKFLAMNKFYQIEGKKDRLVGTTPDDFATVELLETAIKKVEKFFVTRLARKDNRVDLIMDTEDVTVLAPLTYAAAVRYGWDAWPWAVQDTFEERLEEKGNGWNDPWIKVTKNEKQVIVYITFKCAMPSWITFENSKFSRSSFQNLALLMPTDSFRTMPIMEAKVHDEEGRSVLTLGEVRQQIGAEFTRRGEEVARRPSIRSVAGRASFRTRPSSSACSNLLTIPCARWSAGAPNSKPEASSSIIWARLPS
jgi:hypothetical protein